MPPALSFLEVLGYLNRNALDTKNLIKEIKAIASTPTERYFFNVADEAALLEKAGTLGEQIFSIEGKKAALSFKCQFFGEFVTLYNLPYGYEFINHSEKPAQVMLPRKIDKAYAYIAYKGKCKALASRRKQGIQPLLCFAQKMRHQYG